MQWRASWQHNSTDISSEPGKAQSTCIGTLGLDDKFTVACMLYTADTACHVLVCWSGIRNSVRVLCHCKTILAQEKPIGSLLLMLLSGGWSYPRKPTSHCGRNSSLVGISHDSVHAIMRNYLYYR
ncbi:hypothetical protein PR048_030343 [Dryococelus australis]|uniref:Uncharacterized protein n=1 Tax=Dryococelus australis TaxID=614101 RepID=A0ABQ9G9H5_9NEOP|nr:hypothetical protein PR048_030343 [Dryococelus australis]